MINILPNIDNREQSTRQRLNDIALTNTEAFRAEATKAYHKHTTQERKSLSKLKSKDITIYNVLAAWQDELLPLLDSLGEKQTDDIFCKFISKNLILNKDNLQSKIEQLITERKKELLTDFTLNIYPLEKNGKDKHKSQRKQALKLLSLPKSSIINIKTRFVDYIICKEIANKNNLTVIDAHSSFIKRGRNKSLIRSERKKAIKSEKKQLIYVKSRFDSLSAINGGLINVILDKGWDLMTVLALRNQYEKSVNKLSKKDEKNAVKRLEIFDKETKSFKKEQADSLIVDSDQANLETTRAITKDIDALLLRIFDLTNVQKNQLVLNIKEYRELTQEKANILQTQSNRAKYL